MANRILLAGHLSKNDSQLAENFYCVNERRAREIAGSKYHDTGDCTRYLAVNLHSYFYRGSIEFRVHAGTVNFTKIKHWLQFLQCMVKMSRKNSIGFSSGNDMLRASLSRPLATSAVSYWNSRYSQFQTTLEENEFSDDDNELDLDDE